MVVDQVIPRLLQREFEHDVGQDFAIWEHKRHMHRPALADGDGPIGPYRRWVRQFYESGVVASEPLSESA